jgi:hypothetical protein
VNSKLHWIPTWILMLHPISPSLPVKQIRQEHKLFWMENVNIWKGSCTLVVFEQAPLSRLHHPEHGQVFSNIFWFKWPVKVKHNSRSRSKGFTDAFQLTNETKWAI